MKATFKETKPRNFLEQMNYIKSKSQEGFMKYDKGCVWQWWGVI